MMSHLYYFAYGSNLHPERLKNRGINPSFEGIGWLLKYRLYFDKVGADGSGKCNIRLTGDRTDVVYGAIFKISSDEMKILCEYEKGYEPARVGVMTEEGAMQVETFIACKGTGSYLNPYTWYREWVLCGAKHHGFPKEYISEIQAVEAKPDADKNREEDNLSQIHKLIVCP